MVEIRGYIDENGNKRFAKWFDGLDAMAAAKVTIALTRMEKGNFSKVQGVGGGGVPNRFGGDVWNRRSCNDFRLCCKLTQDFAGHGGKKQLHYILFLAFRAKFRPPGLKPFRFGLRSRSACRRVTEKQRRGQAL